ncbi:hypothetical protein HanRHA438_Chr05g0209231 [Helianthus annuus]|uniref:uncharacterized protein LOC110938620 n=1 Tax=Helianthus annuus TaxID=4232 RepID=UPI000B906BCF|nr:uncharacterized protein LOC110938620 [Helianthus annuus]KAJ0569229.1 hypothetical protein HanHA300_Chr05g0163721 [Helianthus annuus]KAJ0917722.1 hypothetical protein HanRHA438_Chr05g0209231 [Helianthus annuus]
MKVGEAMGLAVSEDATASAGHPVADGRKKLQLVEEHVKATKAILMSLLEEWHQHGKMVEALKADLMSLLEQHQHDEQIEALKASFMNLQELQLLLDHDIFTSCQSVATSEQEVAAYKHLIVVLMQRIAAIEQRITMANDRTEPTRARVGVCVAVTIGVFSHIYR